MSTKSIKTHSEIG